MDKKTRETIRKALLERHETILHSLQQTLSSRSAESSEGQTELVDIAQNLEQLGREMSLARRDRRELEAIENALSRIDLETFGICENCDERIVARRLMVLPHTRFCAACQELEEKSRRSMRPEAA